MYRVRTDLIRQKDLAEEIRKDIQNKITGYAEIVEEEVEM